MANAGSKDKPIPLGLLITDEQTAAYAKKLLAENDYKPHPTANPVELCRWLKKHDFALVLLDCLTLVEFGANLYAKIKVACPRARIILFGNPAPLPSKSQREIFREGMEAGVYGCIRPPYKDWEVLSMVRHIIIKENLETVKRPRKRQNSA